MDALKNATNVGTTTTSQQSGEEPVSGDKGQGTISEPYDQGNQEGKEGAGPKEGMSEALDDTKKAASDAAAGQSL
ncbi:hypothetical protein OEA41_009952 [Lepraria neglecta]|uniref:Uncharacterized protein n=1 Tax=Lepraria neglecta TaxID=209136 RepID=A0AAE0DDD4_9LECA|nr:hypothetical protein OEA41_009952 [Lepraria neglecta]